MSLLHLVLFLAGSMALLTVNFSDSESGSKLCFFCASGVVNLWLFDTCFGFDEGKLYLEVAS